MGQQIRHFGEQDEMTGWEEQTARVPLLYNQNDPRFAYAFSSSEQVKEPYYVVKTGGQVAIVVMCVVGLFGVRDPKPAQWDYSQCEKLGSAVK